MKQIGQYLGALALSASMFSVLAFAQAPAGQAPAPGAAPADRRSR